MLYKIWFKVNITILYTSKNYSRNFLMLMKLVSFNLNLLRPDRKQLSKLTSRISREGTWSSLSFELMKGLIRVALALFRSTRGTWSNYYVTRRVVIIFIVHALTSFHTLNTIVIHNFTTLSEQPSCEHILVLRVGYFRPL